jgi:PAS domain S-box-containing protein
MTEAQLYRRIIESAQEAIVFADRDGIVRLWNSAAESIFGYPADEVLGQSLDLIIPEALRERHWVGYRKVIQTGSTQYGQRLLAVPAVRKDGVRISIEFHVSLIRDSRNVVCGLAAIIRDVTARWEEMKDLRARLARLEGQTIDES